MAGILQAKDDGLGIITLNDPAGGNRLDHESLEELYLAVQANASDPTVRALLLRSSGSVFSHGMNLTRLALSEGASQDPRVEQAVAAYGRILETIHDAPKPVVAMVNGSVKGGGVGLVSACDIVIASEESTFELGEAFFGVIPANVLPFLMTMRIPIQTARYLVLTCRALSARDAASLGLVDEVYPGPGLERGARDLLKRMWRVSPHAAAEAKAFTRILLTATPREGRDLARAKLAELLGRAEVTDAIQAFEDGGAPPWFRRFRPASALVLPGSDSGGTT